MFVRDMVCLRNISVDTLHNGDTEDNNNNNNVLRVFSVAKDKSFLNCLEKPLAKPRPRWRLDVRRIGCGVV
jgi:hypothetical protein